MEDSEDEIQNTEIVPSETYDFGSIPPEHCFYCGVHNPDAILQCQTSSNWYCTDPISGGCHFTWHFNLRDHKIWSSHPQSSKHQGLFNCSRCKNSNITMLCVLNKTQIVCRGCGINIKNKDNNACLEELISNGNPSSTVFGQSTPEEKEKKRKLSKRQINKIEDNLKKGKQPLDGLDNLPDFTPPLTKIKRVYNSVEEYIFMYRGLLLKDMKYSEEEARSKTISDIGIVFENLAGTFDYDRYETNLKLSVGSPITIYKQVGSGLIEICDAVVFLIDSKKKRLVLWHKKNLLPLRLETTFQ